MKVFQKSPQWESTLKVCNTLQRAGFQAVLAGGCVRDALLNIIPKDFDVATNATPDQVESLFDNSVSIGKQFGVIAIPFEKHQIEIATFRKEEDYQDGRHPGKIEYSNLVEDAKRRDFTINALFYDIQNDQIIDEVQGLEDLNKKIIKCVGVPRKRFEEDKLRILRAVRFASQLGFEIEEETYMAIKEFAPQVKVISIERIRDEINKLFLGKHILSGLALFESTKLLNITMSFWKDSLVEDFDLAINKGWSPWTCFKLIVNDVKKASPLSLWTLGFFLTSGEKSFSEYRNYVEKSFKAYKVSNSDLKYVVETSEALRKVTREKLNELADYKICYDKLKNEFDILKSLLKLELMDPYIFLEIKKLHDNSFVMPIPLLTGKDLLDAGVSQGPRISKLLNQVYHQQLNEEILNMRQALDFVKKNLS